MQCHNGHLLQANIDHQALKMKVGSVSMPMERGALLGKSLGLSHVHGETVWR